MAPKNSQEDAVVKVGIVPAYLMEVAQGGAGDESIETMRHHRILNRVAMIQSNSPSEKKQKYGEGSAAIPATESVLIRKDETVEVVPVMFFDEFIQWGDRKDKEGPMIRAKTLDRASILAKKCQDGATRWEAYGEEDQFNARNVHHLNFLAVVIGGPLNGQLLALSFARGEWKRGMTWIGMIRQRRIGGQQAPLWTTRWNLSIGLRKNEDGEWYGIDVNQPDELAWADEADLPTLQAMHETLKQEYKDQALSVGHEVAEEAVGDSDSPVTGQPEF